MNTEETNPQNLKQKNNWFKNSISAKMIVVGILVLVLLIPLGYTKSLIQERADRQGEVIDEINNKWGKEVLLYGPIVKVPYYSFKEKLIKNAKENATTTELIKQTNYIYLFPKSLEIDSEINPEEKKRGIYKTAVYKASIKLAGKFDKTPLEEFEINEKNIDWEKAKFIIQTSNLKGINSQVSIKINNKNYNLNSRGDHLSKSMYALRTLSTKNINLSKEIAQGKFDYDMHIAINGSEKIRFIPIGAETKVNIKSNWKDANFIGNYIPQNKDKINENGFDAIWKIFMVNRPYTQAHISSLPDLKEYAFGVNFLIPVDGYQKSERSSKYGFLVIGLTFVIFMLIQIMSKINIHPFQYLMIGIALVMFYTLLISISEHSDYLTAYLISGTAVIVLITAYSKSIFKNFKFPLLVGGSLFGLYSFIFVIIQLENYALLVGSIGLFLILATVMYTSRHIDWENH